MEPRQKLTSLGVSESVVAQLEARGFDPASILAIITGLLTILPSMSAVLQAILALFKPKPPAPPAPPAPVPALPPTP